MLTITLALYAALKVDLEGIEGEGIPGLDQIYDGEEAGGRELLD